jgi:flagellar biosynthesis protein FliR
VITLSLMPWISGFLFIGVRLSGLFLFAPVFGSSSLPNQLKAGLVLALSILLFPVVSPHFPPISLGSWPLIVMGELATGAAMGICTQLIFDAVQMAGQILSIQMGYSLISILDPSTQAQSTVVATFYQAMVTLIFLRLDVHLWILRALGDSFGYLPPGSAHLHAALINTLLNAAGAVFVVGIELAAPVLSATLLADLILGFLGKASPQLPVMLLGTAIKSLIGIVVLISSLKYWPGIYSSLFTHSLELAVRVLHLAR